MLCGCTNTGETPSAAPAAPAPSASAPASSLPVPESSLPVPESTEAPAATEPVVEVPEDLHPMLFRVTGEDKVPETGTGDGHVSIARDGTSPPPYRMLRVVLLQLGEPEGT
jgi:hypothetical protein